MAHTAHDIGVSKHIGSYSDAIETEAGLRWLYTAGTPGIKKDGELPEDFASQARLALGYMLEALGKANMSPADLVKVTTSVTDAKYIAEYVKIRAEILGDVRPAFMLQVVNNLIKPGILVEVEIIAAKK